MGAEGDAVKALALAREVKDPQIVRHVFSSYIRINVELGRLDGARALADELLPTIGVGARLDGLIELAWVAGRIGVADELRNRLQGVEPATSLWLKAGREILDEQFEQAAETFAEIGCVPDEAEARLRAGLRLLVRVEAWRRRRNWSVRERSTARSVRRATSPRPSSRSPTPRDRRAVGMRIH